MYPFILKVPLKQKQILVNIFLDSKNLKFKLIYLTKRKIWNFINESAIQSSTKTRLNVSA